MNPLLHYSLLSVIPAVILFHLSVAPYTKVEESFNIQAVHDVLKYGIPVRNAAERLALDYDHITFTGAVPRSFVGALALTGLSKPFASFCTDGKQLQILVRGILGMINAGAILSLERAVSQAFGQTAGYWYILFQASQFHVMYYASRTLPNFLAFPFATLSSCNLILAHFGPKQKKAKRCQTSLALLTAAGIIFRSELALLLAHMTILFVLYLRISLRDTIMPAGISAALVSVLTSIPTDSFFWQRAPLWPEFNAFVYNTIEGKSSDWGTSPWHYYFTNSIPKLMMNPVTLSICLPAALLPRTTQRFSLGVLYPLLAFAATYSFLPHKEWRFIVYIIPGLTAVASAGASWIWTRRYRTVSSGLLSIMLLASVLLSFAASLVLLGISSLNYPGAEALQQLQSLPHHVTEVPKVYLDNLCCQTGVTRFLQDSKPWEYDKTEDAKTLAEGRFWSQFDYVLAENSSAIPGKWRTVKTVFSYEGVSFTEGRPLLSSTCNSVFSSKRQSICITVDHVEIILAQRLTRGRWPRIKLAPKISILTREGVP